MLRTLSFFSLLSVTSLLQGLDTSYLAYLDTLNNPKGDHNRGEIEMVISPSGIEQIEQKQKARLLKAGFSEEEATRLSHTGVICEDQYWLWIRDAVIFPSGAAGTYNRLIWKSSLPTGSAGVAILPVMPDGRIALNLNYRHATRSWELELPRGLRKAGETNEETALRELKEETGLEMAKVTLLGSMAADTGVLGAITPIYLVQVSKQGISDQEYSEAIADVLSFTKEELEKALMKGSIEVTYNNQKLVVPVRDSHLAYALLQAKLQGLQ